MSFVDFNVRERWLAEHFPNAERIRTSKVMFSYAASVLLYISKERPLWKSCVADSRNYESFHRGKIYIYLWPVFSLVFSLFWFCSVQINSISIQFIHRKAVLEWREQHQVQKRENYLSFFLLSFFRIQQTPHTNSTRLRKEEEKNRKKLKKYLEWNWIC